MYTNCPHFLAALLFIEIQFAPFISVDLSIFASHFLVCPVQKKKQEKKRKSRENKPGELTDTDPRAYSRVVDVRR